MGSYLKPGNGGFARIRNGAGKRKYQCRIEKYES
jgi:hypothetical protein